MSWSLVPPPTSPGASAPPSPRGAPGPLTFVVVFAVEGQGVALRVLLALFLGQVGVGVVVAEPRPVLIPLPTDCGGQQGPSAPPDPRTPPQLPEAEHPTLPGNPDQEGGAEGARFRGPSLPPSSRLTIADIRLVSVLQGRGVLAFPETTDAIRLGGHSGVRGPGEDGDTQCGLPAACKPACRWAFPEVWIPHLGVS